MDMLLGYLHALAAAVLVGKVVLLSFVVAPVLASQLQQDSFASVVRRLFPAYYALGMGAALLGVLCVVMLGMIHEPNTARHVAAGFWLLILAAEAYCRAPLTPQSNAMRDRLADQARQGAVDPALQDKWDRLHRRSLYLNSLVLIAGLCLVALAREL